MNIDDLFSKIPETVDYKQVQKKKKNKNKQLSQELKNELVKLDLVKLTQENLYGRFPNILSSQQNDVDKSKYQILEMIGDQQFYADKVEQKNFLLGKYEKQVQMQNQQEDAQGIKNPIKNNLIREKKVLRIKDQDLTFKSVRPMHQLWKLYIEELMSKEKMQESIFTRLLKADFHGAWICVCYAKCKSYEGIEGIVIEERLRSFVLIDENDRKLVILKENSIFLVEVNGKYVKIFGCQMMYRAADRMKVQFKYHRSNKYINWI